MMRVLGDDGMRSSGRGMLGSDEGGGLCGVVLMIDGARTVEDFCSWVVLPAVDVALSSYSVFLFLFIFIFFGTLYKFFLSYGIWTSLSSLMSSFL